MQETAGLTRRQRHNRRSQCRPDCAAPWRSTAHWGAWTPSPGGASGSRGLWSQCCEPSKPPGSARARRGLQTAHQHRSDGNAVKQRMLGEASEVVLTTSCQHTQQAAARCMLEGDSYTLQLALLDAGWRRIWHACPYCKSTLAGVSSSTSLLRLFIILVLTSKGCDSRRPCHCNAKPGGHHIAEACLI